VLIYAQEHFYLTSMGNYNVYSLSISVKRL